VHVPGALHRSTPRVAKKNTPKQLLRLNRLRRLLVPLPPAPCRAGTGPQVFGNTNAPPAVTLSAIIYSLRCMVTRDIPLNHGCMAPITVKIPAGALASAVAGGRDFQGRPVAWTLHLTTSHPLEHGLSLCRAAQFWSLTVLAAAVSLPAPCLQALCCLPALMLRWWAAMC
jgi:hypothetical protein